VNVADQYPEKVKELEKYSGKKPKNMMYILLAVLWVDRCNPNPIRNG
jgi:hypothetical protein